MFKGIVEDIALHFCGWNREEFAGFSVCAGKMVWEIHWEGMAGEAVGLT